VEKIQKFSDPPLKTCEECGGKLERLISTPAIQFKGSGWYVTDYARKSSAGESSKGDGGSAGKDPEAPRPTKTTTAKDSKPGAHK
jgi:putative FmdB family regulatory protein